MTRVAVITGAAGGVGRATVAAFRADGWQVVGIDRAAMTGEDKADLSLRADLADPAAVASAFAEIAKLGRVHALVNNAAIQVGSTLVETRPDEWDAVMASNVRSAYLTIRSAFPLMKDGDDAAVVNVSSVHAVATSRGIAAYATSKAAMVGMTRAAAIELAPSGIRVNAVLPGAVDTPMLLAGAQRRGADSVHEALSALEARTPLGRVAQPAEIAQAILFLSDSARSSFMTGQSLIVDGGATTQLSTE